MQLPTENEINIYNSLDEITASEHYYNKSLKEIEVLLRDYSLDYCQDLMWIGPVAFNFYLDAIINYLKSKFSDGDSDIVNCLLSVMEYRLEQKEFVLAVKPVNIIVDYIIGHYDKFEVDAAIYTDLLPKYNKLKNDLKDKFE